MILKRKYYKEATIGRIDINGMKFATLELPYNDNQRNSSCIPEGEYTCNRINSHKFGETFQVINVPERDEILFHVGNYPKDTHGCILIGSASHGENMIIGSKSAFNQFMLCLESLDSFKLKIEV